MSAARWTLAVAVAWLMPWRAARTITEQGRSLDALVFALADVVKRAAAAPTRPPLYLVGQPGSDAPPYSGRHLKGVPRTRGSAA